MLRHIQEANGGLDPERVKVIFTNTGREMPETLDFVQECGERWAIPIVWLEYRYEGGHAFERVSHNSASRNGEPFDALIDQRGFLPNQRFRFCTAELKVKTAARFLRAEGWGYWTAALGIRADEAHRSAVPPKERWTNWRPLVDAGVSKRDVVAWWAQQVFDLRLKTVNGKTPHGNCDGCFLKSEAYLGRLSQTHPNRAAWWLDAEHRVGGTWSKRYSRRELHAFMSDHGELALGDESALCQADDGECFG